MLELGSAHRLHIERALVGEGWVVAGGCNLDALDAADFADSAGIFVDLNDDGFDGVAFCRILADHRDKRLASGRTGFLVIGVSVTLLAADTLKAALGAGADDVIETAGEPEVLRLRLRALMRHRFAQDAARSREAEPSSAESTAELFRVMVQSVVDYAIYMLDPVGRVTTWNAGAERIKGYSAAEIIGQNFSRFYTPGDFANGEPARALEMARTTGRYEKEALRVRKDGAEFWAHVVIDPIRNADGEIIGYAKITRDITERRVAAEELQQARTALMQAQKMEAIGQLTGGIAHDFNNMLAGIIGGLNLLQRRIAAKRFDETDMLIEAALNSANRAASLTSRLLTFGRRQSLDIKPIDVNETVASMRLLFERTMGEKVAIIVETGAEDVWAMTDVSHLESAILNLAINARDAMIEGGQLSIETGVEHLSGAALNEEIEEGEYAFVSVRDTGAGISPDILEKVFEPFFTTKPIGQGTGLGLSMVYGFVRQSRGHIRIDSKAGWGTRVTVWLPRAAPVAQTSDAPAPSAAQASTDEMVLIVEDDAQVRLLVREVLKDLGYGAIEASNASEALAIVTSEQRIDLIVSDVGLPGLDGRQFAELSRTHRPDLKILFMTGYAEHAAVRSAFLGEAMDMIAKPFALDDLADKVRAMIASV